MAETLTLSRAKARRNDDEEALLRLQEAYRPQRSFKYNREATWFQTILFCHDLQYTSFNMNAGKPFFIGQGDSRRVRITYNVMKRMAEDAKSVYVQQPYDWNVVAMTRDTADIEGSHRAADLVRIWHEKFHIRKKQLALADYLVKMGNGFIHVDWDAEGGDELELAMPDGEVVTVKTGDLTIACDNPYRWFFHPSATHVEESPFATRRTAESRNWVRQHFPKVDLDELGDLTQMDASSMWEHQLLNLSSTNSFGLGAQEAPPKGGSFVEVFRHWEMPGPDYKKGLHIVALGTGNGPKKVVHVGDMPHDRLPVFHFGMIQVPNCLWHDTFLTSCVSPQREVNRRISQLVECGNLTANPQVVVPSNGFAPQVLTNRPGGVMRQDPNAPWRPYYLPGPNMPAYAVQQIERSLQMMDSIASPFGPSSSSLPKGATSGIHFSLLQNMAQQKTSTMTENWECGWKDVWSFAIDTYRSYGILPRHYEYGFEGSWRDFYLAGRDLPKRIRFEITKGSSAPKSRATSFAEWMEILKVVGPMLMQDPRAMNQFWTDIGYGDMVRTYRDRTEDADKAQRNIQECLEGNQPIIDDWDDPDIHMPIYESEMNTDAYKKQWPDRARISLFALREMFKAKKLEQLMQAQAALAMAGAPKQPGAGEPPMSAAQGPFAAAEPGAPVGGNEPHMTDGFSQTPNQFANRGGRGHEG